MIYDDAFTLVPLLKKCLHEIITGSHELHENELITLNVRTMISTQLVYW